MYEILKSKTVAWLAFILVIVAVVSTFGLRSEWWTFCDIFFIFMATFSHLIAVNISKFNAYASRKLDTAALVFAILFIIALAGECVMTCI